MFNTGGIMNPKKLKPITGWMIVFVLTMAVCDQLEEICLKKCNWSYGCAGGCGGGAIVCKTEVLK
jgi:hypothetical protein